MNRIKLQLYAIELCALLLLLCMFVLSFQRVQALAEEKQEIYLENALSQAAQGVERKLADIAASVQNYAYSDAVQDLLRAEPRSAEMLGRHAAAQSNAYSLMDINQDIVGIAILPPEGTYFSFGLEEQYRYVQAVRAALGQDLPKAGALDGSLTNAYGDQRAVFTFAIPIFSVAQGPGADLGEYLGTCLAFCDKGALERVLRVALLEGMTIELRGGGQSVLTVGAAAAEGELAYNAYELAAPGWTLVQRSYRVGQEAPYLAMFGLSLGLSLAVLFLLSWIVHRNFTAPITRINAELLRMAEQPLQAQDLRVRCGNELATIAQSVNVLLSRLRASQRAQAEQETHVLRAQLSVGRLQLALLQNQINPHFLYNTLACIRGIALSRDVQEIADIAADMAALYRYSIKGGVSARLRDELDIVRRYLEIMNARMDGRFCVRFEVPEALGEASVPKMILQPLVENAILHGLECRESGGELRICAAHFPGDGAFLLHVWDNGLGMEPEAVRAWNEAFNRPVDAEDPEEGLGLLCVHRKVRLHCGEPYGLHLESRRGAYTRASLLLPLRAERGEP